MNEPTPVTNHEMDSVYVEAVHRYFNVIKVYWERKTPTFIIKQEEKALGRIS
jgi:hypothetical protein